MIRQSAFTRRIIINKDLETVFNAWAMQSKMEEWFLKRAIFLRKELPLDPGMLAIEGDSYEWTWHGWPDNIQTGIVVKCMPHEEFGFTFDPGGNVDVNFIELPNEKTEVVLTQYDIGTDDTSWYNYFHGCSLGWSFWLVNLKAYLEYGIVLDQREIIYTDDKRTQIVNQ